MAGGGRHFSWSSCCTSCNAVSLCKKVLDKSNVEGGVKNMGSLLGSPYSPRQRRAKKIFSLNPLGTEGASKILAVKAMPLPQSGRSGG